MSTPKRIVFLYLTNKLVRPNSWTSWIERYRLGNYSTAYYQFIIEVTGETEFPIQSAIPGYNNGEKWSSAYTEAFIANLKQELKARNDGKKLLFYTMTVRQKTKKLLLANIIQTNLKDDEKYIIYVTGNMFVICLL